MHWVKSTSTMLNLQSIYNRVSFNMINFICQRRKIEPPISSHCEVENQKQVINNCNKIGMKIFCYMSAIIIKEKR